MTEQPDKETQALQELQSSQPSQQDTQKMIEERAAEIAERKVQEKLQQFGKTISGEEPSADKPKDWKEVYQRQEQTAKEIAEQTIKEYEAKQKEQQERKAKQLQQSQVEKTKEMSKQWWELIDQGRIPKPDDQVLEKMKSGSKLTQDEIESDPAMKSWFKLKELAEANNKTIKEAFYEDFNKKPAGANAPVFGAGTGNPAETKADYSYEDIRSNREKAKRLMRL